MTNGLGRRLAKDTRDRPFMLHRATQKITAPKRFDRVFYRTGKVMNQGDTPQCVAYAWSLFMQAFPIYANPTLIDQQKLYDLAQQLDEFSDTPPGEGTSVRAGAKALQQLGHIKSYVWTDQVTDVIAWMQAGGGTVVVGTDWLNSMWEPDRRNGRLEVDYSSGVAGGHAWLLCGYDPAHDFGGEVLPAFRMQNSWGEKWGDLNLSRAWVAVDDMQNLFDHDGEVCCGVEVAADALVPENLR